MVCCRENGSVVFLGMLCSSAIALLRAGAHRAQVFCYKGSAAHEEMRGACFDYLRLGGWYSAGGGPLLGLNWHRRSPLTMERHT